MGIINAYVLSLTDAAKARIVEDYEYFLKYGNLKNEPIRAHALEVLKRINNPDLHISNVMDLLALECYKYFTHEWLAHQFFTRTHG